MKNYMHIELWTFLQISEGKQKQCQQYQELNTLT